ncbi:MAG: single-stranded-DNA-specific exonuclease RecJ [Pseudomonadota bacterium]
MLSKENPDAFLNVQSSVTGQRWVQRLSQQDQNTALAIAQTLDIPELIGRVMAGRGVALEEAGSFMSPAVKDLMPDPDVLTDMKTVTARISKAIQNTETVAIFGDYDVDGACSSALMFRFLAAHGLEPRIYIPDRIFEGYGPNPDAIRELVNGGATLIITVDCGATSFEALEEAAGLGVDVVVLDHHQMGAELPKCVGLVNPNRQDDLSGLGHLCAAGVVFMTLVSVARELRNSGYYSDERKPADILAWLDLVALATVCDVVPLEGLNRAFVVKGLQVMGSQRNAGLKALMRVGRLDGPPRTYHLGFVLGPRINAGGRIGDAALGARLLTTEDEHLAREIAEQLEMLNQERQKAEARMLEEAIAEADAEVSKGEGPAVLVTASDQWHPGIVGLLASRLKDRFKRPAFAVSFDGLGKGSGSGRSVHGVDLGAAVRAAVDEGLLEKGGGHAMAAGLTVSKDKLGDLRAFFETRLSETVDAVRSNQQLKIDGALTARSATLDLIELLEKAGPYGQGHPQPVFAFPAHHIRYAKVVGADHVSFTASAGDGSQLRGIAFRSSETELGKLLLNSNGQPVHLVGTLNADFWQGSRRVQLRVLDAVLGG